MDPDSPLVVVGWREWVAFPDVGLPAVRAKVDTGAATSALHAHAVEPFTRGGAPWARFTVHPFFRRHRRVAVRCEAPVVDERAVTSSSGHTDARLVVGLTLRLGVRVGSPEWPVEVTLADRQLMAFPMLLGREAMVGRVLVDPGASFRLGTVERAAELYGA
ncbi:MAG TPA: RimK/LysX family protein [Rubricoccaceae bacterium]